ncbi:orotidine-5'-phosphate decarboxylase [Candidatus Uhrbacteria bacterium]|nr:orotidine-5'-phosphate decarboxylase [Candidatus Uhrbacteria bacterium]
MNTRNFISLLQDRWAQSTAVCVGLDSDYGKIPEHLKSGSVQEALFLFNTALIDATADAVCAYKIQIAYYEACGAEGIFALIKTAQYVREKYSAIPLILDAKRADIGSTNDAYAKAAFDVFGYDAITLHPYLGGEALKPFLDQKDKGCIILCRTSNNGAGEFQDLLVDGKPLYIKVARQVKETWNVNGNCAVVVGATYPKELEEVRTIVGDIPILIPGIGAQGGDVQKTVQAGKNSKGQGMIINSSRGIIFASKKKDFSDAARRETLKLRDEINQYLS